MAQRKAEPGHITLGYCALSFLQSNTSIFFIIAIGIYLLAFTTNQINKILSRVIRKNGKIAITLKDDDELIAARKTDETKEVLIASTNGRMIRFNEEEIRIMGRTASGVKGITVGDGKCVGCEIADEGQQILVVTEKGYGKRTSIDEYRMTHRGSKGVKALNITDKNGNIVSFKVVEGNEDLVIVTDNGIIIRLPLEQVSTTGRVAQGVKLINLKENQKVSTVTLMEKESEHNSIEEETKNEN